MSRPTPATDRISLTPADLDRLHHFRITDELIELHQVDRVTSAQAKDLGIQYRGDLAGIHWPIWGTDGTIKGHRVRRDNPEKENGRDKAKYVQSVDHPHLFFELTSRGWLSDVSVPVIFVEAYSSALSIAALTQRTGSPFLIVATAGCWGWRATIGKTVNEHGVRVDEKGPSPDLDHIILANRKAILCFDSNVETNPKVGEAERRFKRELRKRGADVCLARIPTDIGNGPDDFLAVRDDGAFLDLIDKAVEHPESRLHAVTVSELLVMSFPPREFVMEPIIQTQGIGMVYSKRGVGKTYLTLGIGCAVAAGADFLCWKTPKPRRVLYVDGEMPAVTMRDRLAAIIAGMDIEMDPTFFRLITPDLEPFGIPSLSGTIGQTLIEDELDGSEFLILDNLSTLAIGGKENEGESWLPVQEWVLSLRRRGVSVLFDHHAGKAGTQRGTSRKEDVLDTVIALRHPDDYEPTEGIRFEVQFEKARNIHGDAVEPFEVRMETRNGAAVWIVNRHEDITRSRALSLFQSGASVRDVEKALGLSHGKAQRLKAKVRGRNV